MKREAVKPPDDAEGARLEDVSFTLDCATIQLVKGYANMIEALVKDETPWVIKDPAGKLTQRIQWPVRKVETATTGK